MPVLNPIQPPLAADLPTTWQPQQIVSPDGVSAGLPQQYGYNYLMEQVNAAQQGVNALGESINGLPTSDDVGGYFEIPQGDSLPTADRQPNSLYGQVLSDYTGFGTSTTAAGTGTTQLLGDVPVGTVVKLNESGDPVEFIVVQQGSPSNQYTGFDGATVLLRNDIYSNRVWGNDGYEYAKSSVHAWLNNESSGYLSLLDDNIQKACVSVGIPCTSRDAGNIVITVECKSFLVSFPEINLSYNYSGNSVGSKFSYFDGANNSKRIANIKGVASAWWSRNVGDGGYLHACAITKTGAGDRINYLITDAYGIRPVLVLPQSLYVLADGSITTNQPPTAPASIDVTGVVSGGSATITLTAATDPDPDGSIASYVYERSVDGGEFVQFANVNSLTQTDSVLESWGTVAYRAAAVDNFGLQGPYVTSETETVNSGWVLIGGPVSNLGVQDAPFPLSLTVNVSGETGITGINLQVLLDGEQLYNNTLNQGQNATLEIDTRAMGSGQHEIQAIATKEDYLAANVAWYFVVPSRALPNGGYSAQFTDSSGNPIFPTTTTRDVIGPDGKSAQTQIDEINSSHKGITGHLAFVDAVLGPASKTYTRAADTTYALQGYAPAGISNPGGLLCIYAGYTGQLDTFLNATAEELIFNIPANVIMTLYRYVVDVAAPAQTDPTVNFTALAQPKVVTAATNTGNTASTLNDALTAMMAAFPSQNYYAIVDAADAGVTYYVASQAAIGQNTTSATVAYVSSAALTTWYQGVQMTFVDTSNMPAQFSYLSSPIVSAATSANPVTAGDSLNTTLIAMIKAQPSYYRYQLEDSSGDIYYICSPTQITAGSVSAADVLYCTTSGTYYNGETLTLTAAQL